MEPNAPPWSPDGPRDGFRTHTESSSERDPGTWMTFWEAGSAADLPTRGQVTDKCFPSPGI